jgi:hypothetical protein
MTKCIFFDLRNNTFTKAAIARAEYDKVTQDRMQRGDIKPNLVALNNNRLILLL